MDRGTDIEGKGSGTGDTPLYWAVLGKQTKIETIKLLLDRGADIEAKDSVGKTPLAMATEEGKTAIVKLMRNCQARNEINIKLIDAVHSGDVDKVALLLDAGANIETVVRGKVDDYHSQPRNQTLLGEAVTYGKPDVVKLLLDRGAKIEARDSFGDTPLNGAAYGSANLEIVKLLLLRGADIETRNNAGDTPLLSAVRNAEFESIQEAGKRLGRPTVIVSQSAAARASWQLDAVKLLLARGADTEAKNKAGRAPLYYAALDGRVDIAQLLQQGQSRYQQLERTQWKDSQEQFSAYVSAFHSDPQNATLRRKVMQLAAALPQPPAVPDDARQLFEQATQQIKLATTPRALELPITLLRKAVEIAPWWANAYYNLSRALEMSSKFGEAEAQLNHYLSIKPDDSEARAHLVVIQTEKTAAKQ